MRSCEPLRGDWTVFALQPFNVNHTGDHDVDRSEYVSCTRRHLKYRVNATLLNKLGK